MVHSGKSWFCIRLLQKHNEHMIVGYNILIVHASKDLINCFDLEFLQFIEHDRCRPVRYALNGKLNAITIRFIRGLGA